jgi:hypothetical protein
VHIPAYRQSPSVKFVTVAEPVAAARESIREEFGITNLLR